MRGGTIPCGATTRSDTDQVFTEPYLACAVTLTGVAVGLLAFAKVATTDSGGRERPTSRGKAPTSPTPVLIRIIILITIVVDIKTIIINIVIIIIIIIAIVISV